MHTVRKGQLQLLQMWHIIDAKCSCPCQSDLTIYLIGDTGYVQVVLHAEGPIRYSAHSLFDVRCQVFCVKLSEALGKTRLIKIFYLCQRTVKGLCQSAASAQLSSSRQWSVSNAWQGGHWHPHRHTFPDCDI